MNLLNLLRFVKGYVKITVKGGFIERFINLCSANNIHIWDFHPGINSANCSIAVKKFKLLRTVAGKSGVKITIAEKKGLPFIIKKHKNRIALLCGTAFFMCFTIIANKFVWFIEVTGTSTVSQEEIICVLEQYGLEIGTFAPSFDAVYAARESVNRFNERLSWMSINIKGSRAVIEVRDYIDEHEDKKFTDPCNIVSDFDGIILSLEIYNGDREVSVGSAVKKGDLLISGVIENRDLSANYLEARGKITALHQVEVNKIYTSKNYFSESVLINSRNTTLHFLGFDIPLNMQNCDNDPSSLKYSTFLMYKHAKLPFGISKTVNVSASDFNSSDFIMLLSLDSFVSEFYNNFRNSNILDYHLEVKPDTDKCNISGAVNCIDYIGVKSPIYHNITEF